MENQVTRSHLSLAIILGSVWGLGEVMLGAGLKACAQMMSGSLMTGVALFFIAASWAATRKPLVPLVVVVIASLFKLLDAAILSLPVMSGAIGNPIFAFWMTGLAFVILLFIFRGASLKKTLARSGLGAGTALIAVGLFPLVKFATGVPACVYQNTAIPLSIYFAPVAILAAAVTVPMGFRAGNWLGSHGIQAGMNIRSSLARAALSPAAMLVCITLVILFRMFVS